jgi:hypothetical protein
MRPLFLDRLFRRGPDEAPSAAACGRALSTLRHNRARNLVIDTANEMAARQGKPLIARRPEA